MVTQEDKTTQDDTAERRLNSERPSQFKYPKTLTLGDTILTLFSEPSADSRSLDFRNFSLFLKTSADFRFPDPYDSPILPLNLTFHVSP